MRAVPIFVIAALLSFAIDTIAVPRAPWRRSLLAVSLHVLHVLFLYAALMLLSARPMCSAFCVLAWMALVGVVSNAKLKVLREPFVFSDFSLFSQALRHPRLYFPALGVRATVALVVGVVVLILGCWAEPPVAPHPWLASLLAMVLSVALGYLALAHLPLTLDLDTDLRRRGFFAVVTAYLLKALHPSTIRTFRATVDAGPFADAGDAPAPAARTASSVPASGVSADIPATADTLPDVIVIQSESYFDARRTSPAVDSAAYTQLDRARRESVVWGELTVPAWGGNTMRSEFSFLTGLASAALGYARFYPYAFVRRACAALPGWFKRRGYHTLAIHPYYADFFGRNRVFPLLKFDNFWSITHFRQAQHTGPYVSDAAVADAIFAALDDAAKSDVPAFIFTMTMENHGPLHLETTSPGEAQRHHTLGEDKKFKEFTVYLRHVINSDTMIGNILERLQGRNRPALVCFYGDHVPAMMCQFEALGVMPVCSEYFIWRNFGGRPAAQQNVRVESLGSMVLSAMRSTQ